MAVIEVSDALAQRITTLAQATGQSVDDLLTPILNDTPRSGLLDLASYAIMAVDGDYIVRFFNYGAERIFGYTDDEIIGQPLDILLPPGKAAYHRDLMAGFAADAIASRHMSERGRVFGRRKDGRLFPAEVSISKLVKGDTVLFTAVLADISDQMRVEEQLDYQEKLLHNVSDAIIALDDHWSIKTWNAAAEHLYGWTESEAVGRDMNQLLRSDGFPASVTNQWTGEITQHHKNGAALYVASRVTPIHNLGYVVVNRDITGKRKLEAALRDALERERKLSHLKSHIVSIVSHDLRTPLAGIQLLTDLLRSDVEPARRTDYVNRIQERVATLRRMLDDMLLVGRGLTVEPAAEMVDLIPFCQTVIDDVQAVFGRSNHLHFDGVPVQAMLDRKLLFQILNNLLTNAIKYSPPDGVVDFRIQQTDEALVIEVRDQGMGISPEDQARLFDPFFRADGVANVPGTGLGLTIVQHAVQALGGSIAVESTLGCGTTFRVILPDSAYSL